MLTASDLLRKTGPLRDLSTIIRDDFRGDASAAFAALTVRYRAERAAFAEGWEAAENGAKQEGNPHINSVPPVPSARLAWAWADGWEHAQRWREIAGNAVNWLRKGQPVKILKHAPLGQSSLAGRVGVIKAVHRESLIGYVTIEVPPRGRQKNAREAWFKVDEGAFEPVD